MSTESSSTPRLRRIAAGMSAATVALAILLVAAAVYIAVDMTALSDALRDGGVASATVPLSPTLRALAIALGVPTTTLILWSLWNAFRLFRAYRAGAVVSLEIGRRIRRMGGALIAFPIVSTVTNIVTGLVVSWDNPDGRQLVLSISSEAIVMAITGAMLMMVGWSMVEAARIADENRQFV